MVTLNQREVTKNIFHKGDNLWTIGEAFTKNSKKHHKSAN